jgi:hypothetical protein
VSRSQSRGELQKPLYDSPAFARLAEPIKIIGSGEIVPVLNWSFAQAVMLVLALGTPARADLKAIYGAEPGAGHDLTVEMADDGAMRFTSGDGSYVLILAGQSYSVSAGPGGPIVMTGEAMGWQSRRDRENWIVTSFGGSTDAAPIRYVPAGATTVAGHDGVAYAVPGVAGTQLVLSDEPALLPTGHALAAYDRAKAVMWDDPDHAPENLSRLYSDHGVLRFWYHELQSISFQPIDRTRFTLPAPPLTLAELQADAAKAGPAEPDPPAGDRTQVTRAGYFGRTLYTLDTDGRLLARAEGADHGTDVNVPGPVRDFCALGADLHLVTSDPQSTTLSVWTGAPDAWVLAAAFVETRRDPFLALDCSGPEAAILTARTIRFPHRQRSSAITGNPLGEGAFPTTLQHDGFLYVGINAGEFGGGLVRFPLTGGRAEIIDKSEPVTGLALDPASPDCILASVGLVHFAPSGSIVRICGKGIALAYAKPYTLDPDWRFDPAHPAEAYPSVAFFSLGDSPDGVWAVATDGIYRFGTAPVPAFTAFPRSFNLAPGGVDWSNPAFVLVPTTMNRRFSVSGASLILVPR